MQIATAKNIPQLRFNEFEGEWKSSAFGALLKSSRLGGNYANNGIPNENPLIKMGNLGRGNISLDKVQYIEEGESLDEKDLIKYGDLFFNTRNTLELVGKVSIWRNELPRAYYNSNLMYIEFEDNFFMNYRLNSFEGIKGLRRLATGTTSVAAIYTKDLLKLKLTTPTLPEQQKIAAFLSAVDTKIQQLTKKKELLEAYKKGVMQQLFSPFGGDAEGRGGLRFKDNTSAPLSTGNGKNYPDWEEKMLGDVLEQQVREVPKPSINYLAIGVRSHVKGTFQKPDSDPKKIAMEKLFVVKENDLVVNITFAWEGAIAIVKKEDEGGLVSHRFPTYTFREEQTSYDYFKQIIIDKKFRFTLDLISPGGAGRNRVLSKKEFVKIKWSFPCINEQQKIATFLSCIDTKIEGINNSITQTQTYKRGLLQKMFV